MATSARQYFLNKDKATTTYVDEQIALVSGGSYANPITYVSENGIAGDLSEDDWTIFSSIVTAKSQGLIVVDLPVRLKDDYVVPSGVHLHFIEDGYFQIASGMVLRFQDQSKFNDADHQIFHFQGPIKVEGIINHDYWRPEWFGAMPDDVSANFAHVINEMFDHRMSEEATTGWYPSAFRFKQARTYYTTDPVKYRSLRPTPAAYVSGFTNEDADIVNVYDTSTLPDAGIVYAWTDIDRWVGLTYTSKTDTYISGCVWSVSHVLSDAEASIQDGAGIHRRVSQMNDFIMESPMGSRWGGAILKSAIPESGVANAYGGKVIDAGHETAGYIPTRCVFRGLQFKGHGTQGQLQHEYVCDFSALDLLQIDTCGFFYCNRGIYMRDGGAGAAIVTNSYFVNSTDYNTYIVNGMGNCKFDTCIIENSNMLVGGNSTDPVSFTNCHLEHMRIDVESNRIYLGGSNGTTNSTAINLSPSTCHSYVTIREVGSYVHDHGHYNHIDAGYRYEECKGITSSVVQMAYPASRENGRMILNSGVPWLLSLGISKDGATDASYGDYNFKLYDVSSTNNAGTVTSGTVFKDYGTIEVGGNTSRFIPVWYEQHWDCIIPSGNIMLAASHACNLRATRPLNRTPLLRYADVVLDGTKQNIPGWYGTSAIYNTSSGIGVFMTSGVDGKIRIRTESIPEVQYITLAYSQSIQLEMGKTYVGIIQGTLNSGTVLPQLTVGNTPTYSNQEYHSITPTDIGGGVYQGVGIFRPRTNAPTNISFGHLITPGVMDFTFDFIAIAELGDHTKYLSDGLPECGVFYQGDTIYEENPQTNQNSMYICRGSINTTDYYGLKDPGSACSKGTWVPSGTYLQGEWWAYGTRVFCARYSHSGLTELPTYSGSVTWKAIERSDADYSDPSYLAVPNGSGYFTTIGPAGYGSLYHGGLTGLEEDAHPQYILVDGTRAFTGTVGGVTPTEDAHLATKEYVDDKVINVIDFGADPDGILDSSDAIQDAIDSATGGGIVYLNVGKGSVSYGIGKTIRLRNDVTLQGAGHFNTHIFALSGFYTNTGVAFTSATADNNILDDAGWPVLISATGGSGSTPTQSHAQLKDFALYPRVYSEWTNLDNSDKMHDSTGVYGMFYEFEAHNMGSHGFRRCFNIGINNGTLGGAGISYFGEIGIRVFNAIGFVCHGHSLVGHTIGVDVDECSDASFKIHQETSSVGYRIGPKVYNTKINLGSLFNIESQPFVIHPSAKVIIEGFPANSLMSHTFAGHMHQAEVQPAVEDSYGFINYIPDGDMAENKLNPTYWEHSGGGSAEITKRRALRKYEGTLSSLNNYDGSPKLWCFPGGVAGDETTFEVYSSGIEHLGFLDIRFSCLNSVGVRARITDSGDSDAELYDSGFISGMAVAANSRPFGENVIAGDLRDKEFNSVGPYVLRLTSDSPDGFMISRAMMYRSQSALQTDLGPHSVLASGVQVASSGVIYTTTSDLTTDFPEVGRLSVLDSNNQWLTISYSGLDANTFKNCVWSRRFTDLAVDDLNDASTIYRYYDASTESHQGFGAYNFRSGPVGGDNQSTRVIVGTTLTEDVPHRVVGWTKSLGNQALIGNEHAVLQVYDTSPSGPDRHNQTWIPNSGITNGEYEDGWTFIDMMASTSYYAYLEKRAADIAFAGVGFIKPVAQKNGKFMFTSTPTEGWWAAGDEILINGVPYYCSVAGDPGTWVTASGSSSPTYSYFPQGW